ncbi:MAG: SDR family NAD(P)-dependent oxidoreductase [Dehalococcoidales bacterium]|nr:SDR family NAD(P)-dependent oxidoreductase [Dehalococcoidales bacterium]
MGDRLKGKVAVVTGSGQNIGRGIAIAMAKEGAKVVTNNRQPGSTDLILNNPLLKNLKPDVKEWVLEKEKEMRGDAETTAKAIRDLGGEAVPFFGSVADFETAGKLIKTAVDNFGKIDILVNNAGTFERSPIWEMTPETWQYIVGIHLFGTWNCIRHAVGFMKEQRWGRIINCITASGSKNMANYQAAKGGIAGLTKAVARDMWEFGVTCNAYSPSARSRPSLRSVILGTRDKANVESLPPAEAVGPFVVYLATEEAAHVSGSIFKVHGGHVGLFSEPEEIATIDKEGIWTLEELDEQVSGVLLRGYKNQVQVPPR